MHWSLMNISQIKLINTWNEIDAFCAMEILCEFMENND